MLDQKVAKDPPELIRELKDHLKILRDDLVVIAAGKHERVRVVATSLRALLCDKRKGNPGLLTYLVRETGFPEGIERNNERISLVDYLSEPIFKSSGGENYELTRCTIIRNEAQQDGLAHAALERSYPQFVVNAVLEMGKSVKTNPRVGLFLVMGYQALEFGQRFLAHYSISLDDEPARPSQV